MQSFIFWASWRRPYRWILFGLLGLMAASLVYMWFSYFQGAAGIISWEKFQEQKVIETTIHQFRQGPFTLSVPGENYVILEYFNGSAIHPNTAACYAFLAVLMIGVVVLLTVVSTLDRFWFLAGMGLFILFVVSLRLEVLSLFGQRNIIPTIVVLVVYVGTAFFFNTIKSDITFPLRLLVFFALTAVTAAVVVFFSGVYYPMIHLAVTGYTPALILSVLFVLMVSHEILAWLLYVVSQGRGKSAQHFIAISLIYLFNVMVAALHEAGAVQWNFLYINVFLLLTVSAILGIWGFRERETLYDNIMPFAPTGSYFIVALGAICCMTIAFLLDNHNDAAVKIVRDITIFAHAGYGLIFFTYVLSNFAQMLGRHLPIHKVVYKPNRMPYFTFRLAGLIALLAFVFYSNWATYVYNGIAGFYNQLGDLYTLLERRAVAESYYEQGRSNGFGNNHANYALGNMKAARYDFEDALVNYDLANIRRPTTYSLINEGNVFFWSDEIRKSVQAYLRGLKEFPNAGPLHNNLGFMYGRAQEIDSALYYLSEASNDDLSKNSAEANSFAVAAMEYLPLNADSLLKSLETNYTATIANALALATSQGQDMEIDKSLLDHQRLNLYTATLLNNYLVRHAKDLDSATMERIFRVADDSLNSDYSEALKASLAPCYYFGGNVRRAIALLSQQAFGSQSYGGKYNYIIGLWILEQGNPSAAARYFQYASLEDYKEASLYRAIALTEDGDVPQAVAAWRDVAGSDTLSVVAAQQITRILTMPRQRAAGLADPEKYQFCRYRLHAMDTLEFDGLMETFVNANYKALSLIEMAQRQFDWDNRSKAIQYLNHIDGLDLNDPQLLRDIHNLQLLILAEQRDAASLSEKLKTSPGLGATPFLESVLAEAVIAEMRNDTVTAARHFEILANYNSYFEPGIIAAADYFRKHSDDPLKAYTILAEALQVNDVSPKLLRAYINEAVRMGYDEYALSAMGSLQTLQAKYRPGRD